MRVLHRIPTPLRVVVLSLIAFIFLVTTHKAYAEVVVHRVAVIPFQAVLPEEETMTTVRCPICGSVGAAGPIAQGALETVLELFTDQLKNMGNVAIVATSQSASVYDRLVSRDRPILETVLAAGSELQADIVAVGFVYRFRERVGYDYSVKKPASVAFEIHLISVVDGKTLWRGSFDKSQKSLTEDVFQISSFFRGKGKWLTARDLTRVGMDELFSTPPVLEP